MSEEELVQPPLPSEVAPDASDDEAVTEDTFQEDFDQNGLLLKIATNGIAIQDYVKRLKESDILVAVDGEVFLDGPQN